MEGVADIWGGQEQSAPPGSKFFQFHTFLGNFRQFVCWLPPQPGKLGTLLGEILDLPLGRSCFYTCLLFCEKGGWGSGMLTPLLAGSKRPGSKTCPGTATALDSMNPNGMYYFNNYTLNSGDWGP